MFKRLFYKSPLSMFIGFVASFLILGALLTLCLALGMSDFWVAIASIVLIATGCVAVAAKDPTNRIGYWYGFFFAIVTIGSSFNASPIAGVMGLVIGVIYLTVMWVTYDIRQRRDRRRREADFRAFGL